MQGIRFYKEAGLTAAGTADHNNVQIALVLVGIIAEADILGKNDFLPRVLAVAVAFVQFTGIAPMGRAVFLAVAGPALIRPIKQNCHAISGKADKDRGQAFVRPHNIRRLLQC